MLTPFVPRVTEVGVVDDRFRLKQLWVIAGSKVGWTNFGYHTHRILAEDGTFDSGDLAPKQQFVFEVAERGSYHYHCVYHGPDGMEGVLNVK